MTESKTRREDIVRKVKALLAKTVENGCSEDEAMSAAELAGALMEEYDVAYEDINKEVAEERFGKRSRPFTGGNGRRRVYHPVWNCTCAIAAYFDVKVWGSGTELVYFGAESDTDLAHQMTDLLRMALDTEWARYVKSDERDPTVHGRTLRASFMAGMSGRLSQRLRQLKAQRSAPSNGRALVVLKGQIVEQKFATLGLNLRTRSSSSTVRSGDAYRAGQAAGDRVDIGGSKLGRSQARLAG